MLKIHNLTKKLFSPSKTIQRPELFQPNIKIHIKVLLRCFLAERKIFLNNYLCILLLSFYFILTGTGHLKNNSFSYHFFNIFIVPVYILLIPILNNNEKSTFMKFKNNTFCFNNDELYRLEYLRKIRRYITPIPVICLV